MKFTHIFKNIRIRLGESMVYTLVWCAIFLIPFMNAHLMSEHQIDWNKVVISYGKIAPYFIVFVVNNSILAPYLLLKHRYWLYIGLLLTLVTLVFGTIEILDFRYWQFDINLRNRHRSQNWSGTGICYSVL